MEWNNVNDKLPEDDQSIWAIDVESNGDIPTLCYYEKENYPGFYVTECTTCVKMVVTHWMPLPEVPEEE